VGVTNGRLSEWPVA